MIDLDWDPEVDSPATIAIIGGGPLGIEAAIYARFLGYFVSIFEERRVAHRMLDWHQRPLAVCARDCTTSLGHAAIKAQNPDYQPADPDHVFTGKSFAEDYLLPLAKTDLLFDDIHFLSPIIDVSRWRTHVTDPISRQERCNDEFRLVVSGRHRGVWTSRADIVIDCRGMDQKHAGIGPGGGIAIGEPEQRENFLRFTPCDRKFEARAVRGKKTCLIGQSYRAMQYATEFSECFANDKTTQLIWVVRSNQPFGCTIFDEALRHLREQHASNIILQEALGVDQIKRDGEMFVLTAQKEDDSSVEIVCDNVCALTEGRRTHLSSELNEQPVSFEGSARFLTEEPGLYTLRAGRIENGAGTGLSEAYQDVRRLFAMIAGRDDLDLYKIMEQRQLGGD